MTAPDKGKIEAVNDDSGAPPAGSKTAILTVWDKIRDPMDAVNKLGRSFYGSTMFGCNTVAQGHVLALACLAERRNPIELMRMYHIIGGKLSMKADAMLAEFRQLGGEHTVIERSPERAAIVLNLGKKKMQFEFTWEEAQKESYVREKDGKRLKDNWETPRRRMQMLWARLISDSVRVMAPEVNAGQYTPEELSETAFAEPQEDVMDAEFTVTETAGATGEEPATEATPETDSNPPASGDGDHPEPTQPALPERFGVSRDQLKQMKALKIELEITPEQWTRIMEKFGVTTAHDLDREAADRVLSWMESRRQEAAKQDSLSKWANDLAGKAPGATGKATEGN